MIKFNEVLVCFTVKAESFGDIIKIGCIKIWNRFWTGTKFYITFNLSVREADTYHTSKEQ